MIVRKNGRWRPGRMSTMAPPAKGDSAYREATPTWIVALIKYGLYSAGAAASYISFLTTFEGCHLYLSDKLAALVTAAIVQIGLFASTIPIGRSLGERFNHSSQTRSRLQEYGPVVVFLFLFSVSSGFSYLFYYGNALRLNERKLSDEAQATELTRSVLPSLMETVRDAQQADARGILSSPESQEWLAGLGALQKAADDPAVVKNAAAALASQREAARTRVAAADSARANFARLSGALQKANAELAPLQADRDQVSRGAVELARQAKVAREQAAAEIGGNGPCKQDRRTTCSEKLKSDAAELTKKAGERRYALLQLDSRIAATKTEIETLSKQIAAAEQTISLVIASDRALTEQGAAEGGAFSAVIAAARAKYSAWPGLDTFEALAQACLLARQSLGTTMKDMASLGCEPAVLRARYTQSAARLTAVGEFEAQCSNPKRDEALRSPLAGENADANDKLMRRAQAFAMRCIDIAPNLPPERTESYSAKVSDFIKSKNTSGDPIKAGIRGFVDSPHQAITSLLFAMGFDAGILLLSCIAEIYAASRSPKTHLSEIPDPEIHEWDSSGLKVRKVLLGLATEDGRDGYIIATNTPAWNDAYAKYGAGLLVALRDLEARRLANSAKPDDTVTYTISRSGYAFVQAAVLEESTSAPPTIAPGPSTHGDKIIVVQRPPPLQQPPRQASTPATPPILRELRARDSAAQKARNAQRNSPAAPSETDASMEFVKADIIHRSKS
jgi:hypothetical protein